MTEAQLKSFPAFRQLPIYAEHDPRTNSIATVAGSKQYRRICECATIEQVENCLKDARWVPLGAVRAGSDEEPIVVAYFGADS